jgi:hypothetical protein
VGEAALAELKRCGTRGVYAGGDMEEREKARVAVANFPKKHSREFAEFFAK